MIKNKLFVKGGCPFSYKFIIFLNEINKLEDFDINVAHADEPSYEEITMYILCLLYTSPSPRDVRSSRMPSSA